MNSTGRLAGPLIPVIDFHGMGPVILMLGMRRAIVVRASANSILARCPPRQYWMPPPKVSIAGSSSSSDPIPLNGARVLLAALSGLGTNGTINGGAAE